MRNELETITPILDTRLDLATEIKDRTTARNRIAAYFLAHPGVDVEQSSLRMSCGCDAVTQRIRELVRDLKMNIESVPTFLTDAAGKKHRQLNRYRFTQHKPLGRDAGVYVDIENVQQASLLEGL